jgi:hypothetical protein
VALFVLAGSVCDASARTYAERIAAIPYPTDEADWQKKCTWFRAEIARLQSIASFEATQQGTFSLATQTIAQNNVAAVDSRMTDFHCNAAYISSVQPAPAKASIERCIEACKANKSRTSKQCVDACSHR